MAGLTYGSVCSGIEAASVAWQPLGWRPAFLSEIEPFPRAVLKHHHPDTPIHGDFTTIEASDYDPIDLLVGGTPCQDFSIAGKRAGLDGARGNLTLEYGRLARRLCPRWIVWENVPGALSSNAGNDFGHVLACFAGHREPFAVPDDGWGSGGIAPAAGPDCHGLAWRVLDAQFVCVHSHPFAVPQRRRRVFIVGYLGDWRRAAAVLFERESLHRHPAPRRETRKDVAPTISARPTGGGGLGTDFDLDGGLIAHTLSAEGFDASEDGTGRGLPLVPVSNSGDVSFCLAASAQQSLDAETETLIAFDCKGTQVETDIDGSTPTLRAMGSADSHANAGGQLAVAFDPNQVTSRANRSTPRPDVLHTMPASATSPHLAGSQTVRRLTPVECERLQGFPDGYTRIPGASRGGWRDLDDHENPDDLADQGFDVRLKGNTWRVKDPDGPRYKALGNSMAVNVMSWIGQRIAIVEDVAP